MCSASNSSSVTRLPISMPGRGGEPTCTPDDGDADIPVDDDLALVLRGRTPSAADRRVLEAFAAQAAVALRQQRLSEEAEQGGGRYGALSDHVERVRERANLDLKDRW